MAHGPIGAPRLHLLGPFRLTAADGRDVPLKSIKARAMLALLATAPGGSLDRGKIAGLLWAESDDAKGSLRQCLRELRRTLAEAGISILDTDTQRVGLQGERLWIDLVEAKRLAADAQPDLAAIAELCAGELLDGIDVREEPFEQWLAGERTNWRTGVVGHLEIGLDAAEADPRRLRSLASALLRLDPAHEPAWRARMLGHLLEHDAAGAVRAYEGCRQALARHLDLVPGAETEALLRRIRSAPSRQEVARQPILGPIVAHRERPGASIAVEEAPAVNADAADAAVIAALAVSLRGALARKRWLSVVEPQARRLIRLDAAPDGGPAAAYAVTVALFRIGERVRFAAELRRAADGRTLWVENHDHRLAEAAFGIVDEVAAALARRLEGEIEIAEVARVMRQPVESLGAYDCVLRAIPLIFKLTPESFTEADRLLRTAQQTDPNDPLVFAWRSFWFFLNMGQGWQGDVAAAKEELGFVVRRAIELDPKNALALAVAGHIASFINHDYATALDLFDRSLRLDPNSAYAWDLSALTLCYTGDPGQGLERLKGSQELWERHPNSYYFRTTGCIALMLAGEHERAIDLCRRTIRENPSFQAPYRPLIASLGHLGRVDEAREQIGRLQRIQPEFSIDWFRANYPPLHRDYGEHYIAGLRRAGVPED